MSMTSMARVCGPAPIYQKPDFVVNKYHTPPQCHVRLFPSLSQSPPIDQSKLLLARGQQPFYYQPVTEYEARILVLLPSACPEQPVRCRLISMKLIELSDRFRHNGATGVSILSLGDNLNETAEKGKSGTIQLNAIDIEVTSNLHSALRHLRHKSSELLMWVDSLCIDHSNPMESAWQATAMRCIYFLADVVYFYVGEQAQDSDLAIKLLSSLDECDTDFAFLQLLLDPNYEVHWKALARMLERPYWSRISTIQEVALARNAVLCCGPDTVAWQVARRFIKKCVAWASWEIPPIVHLLADMK